MNIFDIKTRLYAAVSCNSTRPRNRDTAGEDAFEQKVNTNRGRRKIISGYLRDTRPAI